MVSGLRGRQEKAGGVRMLGKASKKGRGSASLLFVCANKGELGFSPSFTGSNKTPPLPSARRATLCPDVWCQQLRISIHALPGEGGHSIHRAAIDGFGVSIHTLTRGRHLTKNFFPYPGAKIAQGDGRCTMVRRLPLIGLLPPACHKCGRTRESPGRAAG